MKDKNSFLYKTTVVVVSVIILAFFFMYFWNWAVPETTGFSTIKYSQSLAFLGIAHVFGKIVRLGNSKK